MKLGREHLDRAIPLLCLPESQCFGRALPRGDAERLTAFPAHGQDNGALLLCCGTADTRRIAHEDYGAHRSRVLAAVDREARPARGHDVDLLVAAGTRADLVVLADQLLARRRRLPGVDPERADPERRPDRPPGRAALVAVPLDLPELHHARR